MSRGGARAGSGRKKGDLQKRTREVAEKVAASGELTPLEVILEIMRKARNAKDDVMALDAAKAAAPYIHPRLAAVEVSGKDGGPIEHHVIRSDLPSAEEWEQKHVEGD